MDGWAAQGVAVNGRIVSGPVRGPGARGPSRGDRPVRRAPFYLFHSGMVAGRRHAGGDAIQSGGSVTFIAYRQKGGIMGDILELRIVDRIQIMSINRPEARNAINLEAAEAIAA